MWARLANRLIFCPTRHKIPCDSDRHWIEWERGRFEAWVQSTETQLAPELYVLKFPGTGGRAERSTIHPAECWDGIATEVWTVNPPGYGGSPGRPKLADMTAVATAAWNAACHKAASCPVVVCGNSLGTMSALYVAAHFPIAGALLRNPVPLSELILSRYGRLASVITKQVPREMCPIRNAARAHAPAVVVSCGKDRVVAPRLQQQVISSYAGEAKVLRLPDADHADPPSEEEFSEYAQLLSWLQERAVRER